MKFFTICTYATTQQPTPLVFEFGSSASIGIEGAGSDSDSDSGTVTVGITEKKAAKRSIDVCQIERGLCGVGCAGFGRGWEEPVVE